MLSEGKNCQQMLESKAYITICFFVVCFFFLVDVVYFTLIRSAWFFGMLAILMKIHMKSGKIRPGRRRDMK